MEEEGVVGSWVEQNGSGGRKETPQAEGGVTAGEPEVLEAGAHGAGSREQRPLRWVPWRPERR